jgi:hypothetical protein
MLFENEGERCSQWMSAITPSIIVITPAATPINAPNLFMAGLHVRDLVPVTHSQRIAGCYALQEVTDRGSPRAYRA